MKRHTLRHPETGRFISGKALFLHYLTIELKRQRLPEGLMLPPPATGFEVETYGDLFTYWGEAARVADSILGHGFEKRLRLAVYGA
jgi:hypothetical protein